MGAASEQLTLLRCAVLTPPAGIKPVFVVRKPLLLSSESATADNADRSDGAKDDEQRWGYSTAEAVALAVDEVQRLRTNSVVESSPAPQNAWPVIAEAVGAYARKQLERTVAPRARPERPGYIPRLYEASVSSAASSRSCEDAANQSIVVGAAALADQK